MSEEAALSVLAALVLENGQRWGEIASPFQWHDASAILAGDGPSWHYLTRPRGGSKTTDLAGVSLAWLATMAPPGARGYVFASDKDQAALLIDAASGLVDRTPELAGIVKVEASKITAKSGATVEVRASDAGGAFGLRPSLVIADELAAWEETRRSRKTWTAIASALAKTPGCRFICLTTAGEPDHWSAGVLATAKAHPDRWRVSEVAGPLPWVNVDDLLAQGLRESEYSRLHLNIWTASEDRLAGLEDLEAAAVLDGEQAPRAGVSYLVAADLGLTNDRTVVAVGHSEAVSAEPGAQRRVIIDSVRTWKGRRLRPVDLTEVEAYLEITAKRYHSARIMADPWQASGMLQRLAAKGLRTEAYPFTQTTTGRIGQALHLAIRNRLLWLPDDEDLLAELARVRLRESGVGQARLETVGKDHDDCAVVLGIIVAELQTASYGSSARAWLESQAQCCEQCGTLAPRFYRYCPLCRQPFPVVPEPPAPPQAPERTKAPEAPSQPPGWRGMPGMERQPDPQTVAAMELIGVASRNGWVR